MKKILFFIHDLGPGGAEKVLVNLVNNMDPEQFDITVMTLVGGGVNEQFLKPHVRHVSCFKRLIRGHTHLLKLLSPRRLHDWFIKEKFDIEVAYLEGISTRIISGCPDADEKLVTWMHCLPTEENVKVGFRNFREAQVCYQRFHQVICVSAVVERIFREVVSQEKPTTVLYNTNESEKIIRLSEELLDERPTENGFRLITVGKISPVKAMDRLVRIHARLRQEGYQVYTSILGTGSLQQEMEALCETLHVSHSVSFLGYQTNPYKYVANADLYVCSSLSEGFSTSVTEALIVGTPVCTVEVSGMKEMLGENNEWGIVTENDEEALYQGIKKLLDDPALLAHYKAQAAIRGKSFEKAKTVKAVEDMLLAL